jgi:hypothetical protein
MARTTTSNLPAQDAINLAAKLSVLTGSDRIDSDAIKEGTNKFVTAAQKTTLNGVLPAGVENYLAYEVFEETINLGTTSQTTFAIPGEYKIDTVLCNVETALTISGASTWSCELDDGTTQTPVDSGKSTAKNTKVTKSLQYISDGSAAADTEVKITSAGTINAGSMKIVVIARKPIQLPNA